eukprot:gene3136-6172_t
MISQQYILLFIFLVASRLNVYAFHSMNGRYNKISRSVTLLDAKTIADIKGMSTKEAMREVCGDSDSLPSKYLFPGVDIIQKSPTLCEYIIANPKAFMENPDIAKQYGVDLDEIDQSKPAEDLARYLPVIYLADFHTEYGNLGFMLNKPETKMTELRPELRALRNAPVYRGGIRNQGSSFTMVHGKVGFPDNRAFKSVPGNPSYRLFFSPDIAMANELCLTKDAKTNDFKFFQWGTIWPPRLLEQEYQQKLWITFTGPVEILFGDEVLSAPLWRRVVASLPPNRLQ